MKPAILILAIVLIAAAAVLLIGGEDEEAQIEVMATVNGQPITEKDIELERTTLDDAGATDLQILEFLIERTLLLQAAEQEGIRVTQQDIDDLHTVELGSGLKKQISTSELKGDFPISYEEFLQRLIEQAKITKLLDRVTGDSYLIKAEDVRRVYNESYAQSGKTFEEAEPEIVLKLQEIQKENKISTLINEL